MLIESSELDLIRPHYRATLEISSHDKLFCATVPCQGRILFCNSLGMVTKTFFFNYQRFKYKSWIISNEDFDVIYWILCFQGPFGFIGSVIFWAVIPGYIDNVKMKQSRELENGLLPGSVVKELILEVIFWLSYSWLLLIFCFSIF